MAGWKLRKDKAQAQAPETTDDPSSEDPAMPAWDTPAAGTEETFLPATDESTFEADSLDTEFDDAQPHHLGGVIALGGDSEVIPMAPLPDFEMGEEVNFDDDEVDEQHNALIFHDPESEAAAPEAAAPEAPAPALAASVVSLAAPAPDEAREVPEVAPFVMDTPAAVPTANLPHRLVMRIGKLSASFEVVKDVTVIGRPDSDLHFYPDMEVEMDDAVSRRHAEVLKKGDGQCYLLDSGSTNGTRLNGEMLPPNEEHLLAPGDRIHIGERTEIIFE